MPFVRIWVHVVFATKNREPVLYKELRTNLFEHIKEETKLKSILLDEINGYEEHVHCLLALTAKQNIADIIQSIKGESSHWMNKQFEMEPKFQWQNDYFAVSVSESQLEKVRNYIRNQEKHHQNINYLQEIEIFAEKYGLPSPAKASNKTQKTN